jgi:3-oxoacyl-[acyl-carrier-protein] synthase II
MVPERLGVVFGSEMLYCEPDEMLHVYSRCIEKGQFYFERWGTMFMSEMYPLWMLMYLPNMIACHIGIAHDARGPNNTICQGEASSLLALIEAVTIIQRGHADVMIVGGSSSRLSMSPMLYRGIDHLSSRIDPPHGACRPFDATRDGTVNGEGAAAFVVESSRHARDRGAKVLANIRGWGLSFGSKESGNDAHGRAISRSIELALERANLRAQDVGHVNAHAGGHRVDDRVEAQAIQRVLGQIPVTAPKSFVGNLGSSGGAVEMVASVQALVHGEIPVTLNYTQRDPACPVHVVHGEPVAIKKPTAMILSQSGTGQTAAVVLEAE